jgi:3-keto-L-gulonate-6-phosphate decarboxylase
MFLNNLRRREFPLATTNVVADGNVLATTEYRRRKFNSHGADATTVSGDNVAADNISGDF